MWKHFLLLNLKIQLRINGRNCITFTQRTTQTNYIRISSGTGCNSYVGMIGGQQIVNLQAGGCTYAGIPQIYYITRRIIDQNKI